ncbi:MAG: type II secretion system protein [Fimbriimonadaceae bacterium]|nr:type II secretion system protein [Fimbriimonadaceae bacterium]
MEKEKPLTSIRSINKRSGFTLIELGVVVLVLAMFSALAVPRLVAFQRAEDYQNFINRTKAIFGEARETAIERKAVFVLRVSGDQIELTEDGADEGQGQAIRTVPLPDGVQVDQVTLNGSTTNTETWLMAFYPDGTATRGGVQFDSDGRLFSMQVDDVTGRAAFIDGELPEQTQTKWEAGEREQRGGG